MIGVLKKSLSALALAAIWISVWETAYRLSGPDNFGLQPPLKVLAEFWRRTADLTFVKALGASLLRVAFGFGLSILFGVAIGIAIAGSRAASWLLSPVVMGVQSLPSICWLPLAALWFQRDENAILFVILMGSIGSIVIATRDGLKNVPTTYRRVSSTFGANYWQRLFWVYIPSALPAFISGMKQGWSFAWRSLLAGELIKSVVGVGGQIEISRSIGDYERLFASMILVLLASVIVDKLLFTQLEKRI